ncbi:hypothetical protein ACK32X_19090, partial [Aeromonas dhakensis]|uniref:hypothetical protein n=1 Tax=Aeromonas dhakensis TaxID=196024 RepID=UPI003988075B
TGISAQSGITTLSGKKCLDLWGQIHQHLAKQGFLIDQISTDTHALSIAQSLLGGIELRGYDLRRFNQNLSVFMAEYEEYLDSDGTREPPKLVLH